LSPNRINQWVRDRTHNLIPFILEEAPETLGLVAINALYFKDRWQTPFDAARTERASFAPQSGKAVDVMMMSIGLSRNLHFARAIVSLQLSCLTPTMILNWSLLPANRRRQA
jgi:serine protease inhibitor